MRGGAADARAYSGAFNDDDAQADSVAFSESDSFTFESEGETFFIRAGEATSRATSLAGGSIPLPSPTSSPTPGPSPTSSPSSGP